MYTTQEVVVSQINERGQREIIRETTLIKFNLPMIALALLATLALLSACAFDSTVERVGHGIYTITSVESDAGGSANALEFEVNQQADSLCPDGFKQLSQTKERSHAGTTYTTTVRCAQ